LPITGEEGSGFGTNRQAGDRSLSLWVGSAAWKTLRWTGAAQRHRDSRSSEADRRRALSIRLRQCDEGAGPLPSPEIARCPLSC